MGAGEPIPAQLPDGRCVPDGVGLVITCEHGGNSIPPDAQAYFTHHQDLLATHRGYDPGALLMAEELAAHFAAPMVVSTTSRLVVDLNRSIGHPRLHFDTIRAASVGVRRAIVDQHYRPYRARAEALVRQAVAKCGRVIHLSVHSFTPELDGQVRQADIGLLYDPARPWEVALGTRWKAALHECAPALRVRRNYPYRGKGDGLTAWFRRQFPAEVYAGMELEINQQLVFSGHPDWAHVRQRIQTSLEATLSNACIKPPA